MNIKRVKIIFNYILVLFLLFSLAILFNNKTIEKTIKSNLKALDQEGQNYRLVTSADNVQVPVPKGYVASQVTGENYVSPEYQHTTNTFKGNYTELTWSSPEGEQYPWTQDNNGIWISGNQGIPNSTSTLESEEFDYIKGSTLTINYTYSSQYKYDCLNIDLINLTDNNTTRIVSGSSNTYAFDYTTSNFIYTINNGKTGRYKIKAVYSKNDSIDEGQDSGYIKTSTYFKEDENGETIEVDQKTKIHDGGFVIYQLTDEELETDSNGTSVIINDTNKDEAQTTRNQYVWVPIQNIEDIVRTKTSNNGIMQFGQGYVFSNTSITKETSTETDFYKEPRLIEKYDKTKNGLQRYSKIDKRANYLNKLQEDYVGMIKSINKYKGFYIGRYETGDDVFHGYNSTYDVYTLDFKNPKVVRYNSNTNYVTWYDSYKDLERLAGKTEKYVETGILYDTLFDCTIKWLNETDTRNYEDIRIDSGTFGNYYNSCFKYKKSANGEEIIKTGFTEKNAPTGGITEITYNGEVYNNSPTSSNNIFDIAGNLFEMTRSRYSSNDRILRGGSYLNGYKERPLYYKGNGLLLSGGSNCGVRGQLLIK